MYLYMLIFYLWLGDHEAILMFIFFYTVFSLVMTTWVIIYVLTQWKKWSADFRERSIAQSFKVKE